MFRFLKIFPDFERYLKFLPCEFTIFTWSKFAPVNKQCFLSDPPVFIKDLSSIVSKPGENVKFECQILNADSIEWYYDDMRITDAEGTELLFDDVTGMTSLRIDNICGEDEGDYTVRGINDAGVSSRTVQLQVAG